VLLAVMIFVVFNFSSVELRDGFYPHDPLPAYARGKRSPTLSLKFLKGNINDSQDTMFLVELQRLIN